MRASRAKRAVRSGSLAKLAGEHLQGDVPPEFGVAGTVDLTHAAFAEQCGDFVVREVSCRSKLCSVAGGADSVGGGPGRVNVAARCGLSQRSARSP